MLTANQPFTASRHQPPPLSFDEAAEFLDSWQARHHPGLCFTPQAMDAVLRAAGGSPGQIAALAKLAGFLAGLEQAGAVEPSHVAQAVQLGAAALDDRAEVAQATPPARRGRRTGLAAACWLTALAIVAAAYDWRVSKAGGMPGWHAFAVPVTGSQPVHN